jgi:hypothetical protein
VAGATGVQRVRHRRRRVDIPDDYAADLILAGVVRKLWEYKNGCEFDYRPSDATYFVSTYVNDVGFTVSTHSSPTPLHAALAAYRKTRQ